MMSEQAATQQPPRAELTIFDKKVNGLYAWLKKAEPQLKLAATKFMDVDRLMRLTITAIRKTPQLAECTPVSIIASVMQAAQLGLEPDSVLGHVYLVPYKNKKMGGARECQLIVGYKGMIVLAHRSDMVESVEGYPVYEGDHFLWELGLERKLEHRPSDDPQRETKKLTHAYAIVRFINGGKQFMVCTRNAIEAVRHDSPGGETGPWRDNYDEMAVKTAIRKLFKFIPASAEMQRAAALDERSEAGMGMDTYIDAQILEAVEGVDRKIQETAPRNLDEVAEQKRAAKENAAASEEKKPGGDEPPAQETKQRAQTSSESGRIICPGCEGAKGGCKVCNDDGTVPAWK
jgi:recombination protein RecT